MAAQMMHMGCSLFLIQVSAFVWEDFLLEKKICASKVIIHAADQHCASTRDNVDNLPALKTMSFKRWHIEAFVERIFT